MAKCTPNLKQLPVTVSVLIPGKNIKIANLVIGPEDNIKKLREVVKTRLGEVRAHSVQSLCVLMCRVLCLCTRAGMCDVSYRSVCGLTTTSVRGSR